MIVAVSRYVPAILTALPVPPVQPVQPGAPIGIHVNLTLFNETVIIQK